MQYEIEQENQQQKDASLMLKSLNWKERKEMLLKIQSDASLLPMFALNIEELLKEQNIVCLQLILQILSVNLEKFSFQLPEIANILVNVVLQNTKTSIKANSIELLIKVYSVIPHYVAYILGQATIASNAKYCYQCLEVMYQLKGPEIAAALALSLQNKNYEICQKALSIAKNFLQDTDCLQAMEKEFPEQQFQQILVQAVAGEDETYKLQVTYKSRAHYYQNAKSYIALDGSSYVKYVEMPNMEKLNWKDKKDILMKLENDIKYNPNVSYDFGRQVLNLLNNEANYVCINYLLKFIEVCILNIKNWKQARSIFGAVLQKLKEKRTSMQAHKTIPVFFNSYFKLQDTIDDFIPCLVSKMTDLKVESINMIKGLLSYENDYCDYGDYFASVVNGNCIIFSGIALQKLIGVLVTLLNDSVYLVRTVAQECLVQVIKLHMCIPEHVLLLWDQIFGHVLTQPRCQVTSIQELIYAIECKNYLNRTTNEYKRLLYVVVGVGNLLENYQISHECYYLYANFKFSQVMVDRFVQNSGIPEPVAINYQAFQVQLQGAQQSPVKRSFSQGKINTPSVKSPQKRSLSSQFQKSQASSAQYSGQLLQIPPQRHQIDVTLMLTDQIQQLSAVDSQEGYQIIEALKRDILRLLESLPRPELPDYIDAVFDMICIVFCQFSVQIIKFGIQFATELVGQYQDAINPQTLVKLFDALQFVIDDGSAAGIILSYVQAITYLYGYQPMLLLLYNNLRSHDVANILLNFFVQLLSATGYQDFYAVGLDPALNVYYSGETKCNLFSICRHLLSDVNLAHFVYYLVGYMSTEQAQRLCSELQPFSGETLRFYSFNVTISYLVLHPITKKEPGVQCSPQQVAPLIELKESQNLGPSAGAETNAVENAIPSPNLGLNAKPKKPQSKIQQFSREEPIVQKSPRTIGNYQQSAGEVQAPCQMTTYKLRQQVDGRVIAYLQQPYEGYIFLIEYENSKMLGVSRECDFQQLFEDFCYLLVRLFEINDVYLTKCFENGCLRVYSSDDNYVELVEYIVRANYNGVVIAQVLLRFLVLLLLQPSANNRYFKFDTIIYLLSGVDVGEYQALTAQITDILLHIYANVSEIYVSWEQFFQFPVHYCYPYFVFYIIGSVIQQMLLAKAYINNQLLDFMDMLISSYLSDAVDEETIFYFVQVSSPFLYQQALNGNSRIILEKLYYLCRSKKIPSQSLVMCSSCDRIYSIDMRFDYYYGNLLSDSMETFITACKYFILLSRELKYQMTSPYCFLYCQKICGKLLQFGASHEHFNYRLLKYAALALIEIVETKDGLAYLPLYLGKYVLELSAYYSLFYDSFDETKTKEVYEYYMYIILRLQQNIDKFQGCLLHVQCLYDAYNSFVQYCQFPYSVIAFSNKFQTTYVIQYLMINRSFFYEELNTLTARYYTRAIASYSFCENALQHIVSTTCNDEFTLISQRCQVQEKDIKLFFRFCRLIAESSTVKYSYYWDCLVEQIYARQLQNSLVNSNNINITKSQYEYQSKSLSPQQQPKILTFSMLRYYQNKQAHFNELVTQCITYLQAHPLESIDLLVKREVKDPVIADLLVQRVELEMSYQKEVLSINDYIENYK